MKKINWWAVAFFFTLSILVFYVIGTTNLEDQHMENKHEVSTTSTNQKLENENKKMMPMLLK